MMGCDTKGCLVTEFKNPFKIAKNVCEKLYALMENETGVKGFRISQVAGFKVPEVQMAQWAELLIITFKFKGEDRRLTIHFDCDRDLKDYPEIDGTSCIWFSMGAWGGSELLMRAVLQSVSDCGKVYIDVNDCDDIDFVQI